MKPRLAIPALVLLLSTAPAFAQRPAVQTVSFEAPSVGRTLKYNVSLPRAYDSSEKRYPVLYLLHGLTSNYTDWAKLGAPGAAEGLDLIVVMADGGNSWYVNWAESADGEKNNWEDCIVTDLIGHIDKTYRTIARREGRAINGLSMGGYGGITLGLRHPDLFCSIGSQSGAIAFARSVGQSLRKGSSNLFEVLTKRNTSDVPNPDIGVEDFDSPAERTPKGKLFASPEEADAYDPFHLIKELPREKVPHICIDCGTEDFLIESSREFARLLTENKLAYNYGESPGGHTPPYWAREIYTAVAIQYKVMQRNLTKLAEDER
jgi:S-formylglutathione hydrolase FrmB